MPYPEVVQHYFEPYRGKLVNRGGRLELNWPNGKLKPDFVLEDEVAFGQVYQQVGELEGFNIPELFRRYSFDVYDVCSRIFNDKERQSFAKLVSNADLVTYPHGSKAGGARFINHRELARTEAFTRLGFFEDVSDQVRLVIGLNRESQNKQIRKCDRDIHSLAREEGFPENFIPEFRRYFIEKKVFGKTLTHELLHVAIMVCGNPKPQDLLGWENEIDELAESIIQDASDVDKFKVRELLGKV